MDELFDLPDSSSEPQQLTIPVAPSTVPSIAVFNAPAAAAATTVPPPTPATMDDLVGLLFGLQEHAAPMEPEFMSSAVPVNDLNDLFDLDEPSTKVPRLEEGVDDDYDTPSAPVDMAALTEGLVTQQDKAVQLFGLYGSTPAAQAVPVVGDKRRSLVVVVEPMASQANEDVPATVQRPAAFTALEELDAAIQGTRFSDLNGAMIHRDAFWTRVVNALEQARLLEGDGSPDHRRWRAWLELQERRGALRAFYTGSVAYPAPNIPKARAAAPGQGLVRTVGTVEQVVCPTCSVVFRTTPDFIRQKFLQRELPECPNCGAGVLYPGCLVAGIGMATTNNATYMTHFNAALRRVLPTSGMGHALPGLVVTLRAGVMDALRSGGNARTVFDRLKVDGVEPPHVTRTPPTGITTPSHVTFRAPLSKEEEDKLEVASFFGLETLTPYRNEVSFAQPTFMQVLDAFNPPPPAAPVAMDVGA